jgi:hypothetical protein
MIEDVRLAGVEMPIPALHMLSRTDQVIGDLAVSLVPRRVMSLGALLATLNAAGCVTQTGQPYRGHRGVASAVAAAHRHFNPAGQPDVADAIAEAFVGAGGDYAWR